MFYGRKRILFVLMGLFLGLLIGCSSAVNSSSNISLKEMLPELSDYGFELQTTHEFSREDLLNLHKNIAKQFNIPVSKKDIEKEISVVSKVIGRYEKGDRVLAIAIDKYANKKDAVAEVKRRVNKARENESFYRKSSSLEFKIKEVKVKNRDAFYQILSTPQGYETKLFWADSLYLFELSARGDSWPESEAIEIAKEIKY